MFVVKYIVIQIKGQRREILIVNKRMQTRADGRINFPLCQYLH
jgi:hypothetical protein